MNARPLKRGAATSVLIGPFRDANDGVTLETALTITGADVVVVKGVTVAARTVGVAGGTHVSNGMYSVALDAADVNTVGPLTLLVNLAGTARPVEAYFQVLNEDLYDAMYGAMSNGLLPRDSRDLLPVQHTFDPLLRTSHSVTCYPELIMTPGETRRVGFNCASPTVMPAVGAIAFQGEPSLVVSSEFITVTSLGHDAHVAKILVEVDEDAPEGSWVIKQPVTTSLGGDNLLLFGNLTVVQVGV